MNAAVPLAPHQAELADARARATIAVVDAAERDAAASGLSGFTVVRDVAGAARRLGVAAPDWRAERAMVRAAGVGRLATARVLGEWASLVDVALEAARWWQQPIDLAAVSRAALAWNLVGRPAHHPVHAAHELTARITASDLHQESPAQPYYRQLLDAWRAVPGVG